MEGLGHDVRFALRTFAKNPGFTSVVVITLALGIGANTAIFSLMDQVMLRALPVAAPDRLVVLEGPDAFAGHSSQNSSVTPFSHPMFEGFRDRARVFSGVLAHRTADVHLSLGQETRKANADLVSGTFFPVLGLTPAQGRLLGPDDDRTPGGHPVVVVSHRFFQARLGADPDIVGRTLRLNGHPMTVVGVGPVGFDGVDVGGAVDVFVPLAMQAAVLPTWPKVLGNWRARWLVVMARLQDGVSLEEARAAMDVVYAQLAQEDAQHLLPHHSERAREAILRGRLGVLPGGRGTSDLRESGGTPLRVLMGMVGLVLLIACANVANLLLARGSTRQKELAVRLALGAGRWRLIRQLLVESTLLSLTGGALGLLVSMWVSQVLISALPSEQAARTLRVDPDLRVALFAVAVAILTALVFGLLPALQATRVAVAPTLKNEAGAVIGAAVPFRFRRGLVVAQIALSLLLLVGAGLFTRSLMNLRALDPGFQPEQLVTFRVDPSLSGHDPQRSQALFARVREELGVEAGVRAVSMAKEPLMADSESSATLLVEGYTPKDGEDMNCSFNYVGPEFFATMGIPVLRGRDIADSDGGGAPLVAVVNETFARYFFGDQDPLGRRFGRAGRTQTADVEIVGVVKDGKASSLRDKPTRFFYVPAAQQERLGEMTYYARTAGDADALAGRAQAVVRRVDASLPVTAVRTMGAQIRASLFVERTVATLSAAFGLLATLLAALGLYGVMAYAVAQRTREIGIRTALGAQRRDVLRMVLRDVAILVGLGVGVGIPGGYGLGRLIESQLFGLSARDPLTFAVATSTLLLAAVVAGYLPARRATRVDPMVALRQD